MASAPDPAQKDQHPLLASRPPVTDPITYLTIIEYNLSEENLPVLHQVLQDAELTSTIGWDLIHLLLPLLPLSEECLQDIAAKGNPRECILKVTEALRILEFEEPRETTDEEDESESTLKVPEVGVGESSTSPAFQATIVPPLAVLKFEVLLNILATLHRRVKTKYPSRFLSTSLQAVLLAYNRANTHIEDLTLSAVKFVKTLSGTKRPHLPSRRSSGILLRTNTNQSEPDPEAQSDTPSSEETELVNRLLQSFLTHILEDYVLSLTSDDDVPGLSWASRLMEKYEPGRIPNKPNYQKYADRFANDEDLTSRVAILGQILALTDDLGLNYEDLLRTVMDSEDEKRGIPGTEDEPPATAADIPLSRTGALLLIAAQNVKQELYASAKQDVSSSISIFPEHATILSNFIGKLGPQTVGMEPEPLLDTVLSFGLIALENNNVGEPKDDESFAQYLQTISLISANSPSPSLRGHAHYLTTTVLRSHPHDLVRLTFIRDTLEHCPYENLKASAVSWLKGETLEANGPRVQSGDDEHEETNIFATPVAISTVAPFLWPDLSKTYADSTNLEDSWMQFRQELGFYVAALNFYYLLLQAKHLHHTLGIKDLDKNHGIQSHYLDVLKQVASRFQKELASGGGSLVVEGKEALEQAKADVALLEKVIDWVEGDMKKM
ncbi:yap-binding protein [Pyrenophora tritici-repentis]|uniref:Kinetochor-Ybp2 domain containing protein n=2 Tax=Pyrenophora tritici-repentis TaxID=45151 RepID=A0A2W1EG19_9PLEO|nr:uncharacterized protein PTRG_09920 [Pyrenophora tritici-repentis Pt-1C-BFP]KAA8621707.1 yap-binding protein [Pyrenophora tritici-repentis]EDU42971.1 conserved hypothetical protein [Pyrenophora tritici-repentis Pt-1C-BFP]KAF7573604.1 Kinetochor-Ybp2 domain containing protein [Pyrenophora tritici-repentis]KAG9380856.1 yap-binding protein [Pyrenophora tritici-repentis]KAI0583171.1 yap-binding protein [Pyrenophora tritici-repentis]